MKEKDQHSSEKVNCTICGCSEHTIFHSGNYHLNLLPPFCIVKCKKCGMLYMSPRSTVNDRQLLLEGKVSDNLKMYASSAYNYANVDKCRVESFKNRIEFFQRAFSMKKLKVLDIGTSAGTFLKLLKEYEFEGIGLEPSQSDVKLCQNSGLNVVNGYAENIPFEDETFDIVHANHVFEHLENPLKASQEAYRILKPGGMIYIEVPNQLDNFSFRRDRLFNRVIQRERSISSIHHLWFFGEKTLYKLLKKAGFANIKIKSKHLSIAKGWRMPFSLITHTVGKYFGGGYYLTGYARKPE